MRSSELGLIAMLIFGFSTLQRCESKAADAASEDQTVRERNRLSVLADAELKRWTFSSKESGNQLTVSAEPLMRWSHFDRGRYYGNLYVVTEKERPVAVFAMFRWFDPLVISYVCGTSLSDSPMVASRNGMPHWQPTTSSLQWKTLPSSATPRDASNAGVPATTRPTRLVQMRRIARTFSGEVSDRPVANRTTIKRLRLLPQPIYRYSTDATDGAIFAFANGTTPAVLLCVEADLNPKTVGWRYGIARRWSWESRMKRNGEEVWMAPSFRPKGDSKGPYYLSIIPEQNANK